MTVTHSSFTIERTFPAPVDKVWAAVSTAEGKAAWFGGPKEWDSEYTLDFRVGGTETSIGGPPGGTVHQYRARFHDIVPNERIVVAYEMYLDDTRISVSLGTTEIEPDGDGTRYAYTEQGAYLDGYDDAGQREHGTRWLVDMLAQSLESATV